MRAKIKKQIKVIYGRQIQELEEKMNKYLQESEKEIGRIEVNEMNGGGRIGVIEEGEYIPATQHTPTIQTKSTIAQSKPKLSTEEKMKEEYMSEVELEPIPQPDRPVTEPDTQLEPNSEPTPESAQPTPKQKKPAPEKDRTIMEAMMYGLD